MKKDALTPKQRAFVEAYLTNGQNATEAALKAGYPKRTARQQGSRLLSHVVIAPEIVSRTQKALERVMTRTDISMERTLEYVGRMAFFDPANLFESDGSLKRINEMPEEERAAIAGLEVSELFDSEGGEQKHAIGLRNKVKLADRGAALDKLMRHHALYKDKIDVGGTLGVILQNSIPRPER